MLMQTPPIDNFPDFTMPDEAWPTYSQLDDENQLSVHLSNMYLKVEKSLHDLVTIVLYM